MRVKPQVGPAIPIAAHHCHRRDCMLTCLPRVGMGEEILYSRVRQQGLHTEQPNDERKSHAPGLQYYSAPRYLRDSHI